MFADFVAKALELFMDRIIKAVADETRARGARRVTPSHLYVPLGEGEISLSIVPHKSPRLLLCETRLIFVVNR
jgi:hypothetical protein